MKRLLVSTGLKAFVFLLASIFLLAVAVGVLFSCRTWTSANLQLAGQLTAITAGCALVLVLCLWYLLWAYGRHCHHTAGDDMGEDVPLYEQRLNWLDRLPFEPVAIVLGLGMYTLGIYVCNTMPAFVHQGYAWYHFYMLYSVLWGMALLLLLLLLTCVGRCRQHSWKQSFVLFLVLQWMRARKADGSLAARVAQTQRIAGQIYRPIRCRVSRILLTLPTVWGMMVPTIILMVLHFVLIPCAIRAQLEVSVLLFLLLGVLDLVAVAALWIIGLNLSQLLEACQNLAEGKLNERLETRLMHWKFRIATEQLNATSEGMALAVEERMKSERMKTELITNVSHDIKTPLTSIVNYVDLLSREPLSTEQAQEYVAVLERQSLRLKKLLEDLVEASKAATGNLPVALERLDAGEFLHQVAAEYAQTLETAQLVPVVQVPQDAIYIMADGKHLWRLMDNLLSNACKYSQPGTRVYLILRQQQQVLLQIKNISREALNVSAAELLERFVRGDTARTTEGSGLGLSIAQSLAELQGASFQLAIDGDLFKAELRFAPTI